MISLEDFVDPRIAVLIVWAVFFVVFLVLPKLCIRCLGWCRDGDGGGEGSLDYGYGEFLRPVFLSARKRRDIDELRGGAVARCLGRFSVELEEEHMMCLSEGGDGEGAAGARRGGEPSSPSSSEDIPRPEDDDDDCAARCQIHADMADPDDYIDEEEATGPSPLMASPDDYIDDSDDNPTEKADSPKDGEGRIGGDEDATSSNKNESGGGDRRDDGDDGDLGSSAMQGSEEYFEEERYTHVRIPFPGYTSDGTRAVETKTTHARNPNARRRFPWTRARAAEGEAPTKDDGPGDADGDGADDARGRDERRDVPAHCAVCLDEYGPGEAVAWSSNPACTHAFHRDCIAAWLATLGRKGGYPRGSFDGDPPDVSQLLHYKLECPCCRQDFVQKKTALGGEEGGGDADENV